VGSDFENSSIYVPVGVEGAPGIGDALPADRRKMPPKEEKEEFSAAQSGG
jgi:hypothetical protein